MTLPLAVTGNCRKTSEKSTLQAAEVVKPYLPRLQNLPKEHRLEKDRGKRPRKVLGSFSKDKFCSVFCKTEILQSRDHHTATLNKSLLCCS